MAKTRMVNTRFWGDNYIAELEPNEKLLFLYFLTNQHTNISGIYELPLRTVALDTGLEIEKIRQTLSRFSIDNKIIYENGWVIIRNFLKHQNQRSPKVLKGIKAELEEVPESLRRYAEGIDTLSHLNTNSNSNLNPNATAWFDRLWKEYPKKVGKEEARKAFAKLNPSEELTSQISSSIARFSKTDQWKDNEGRYIPYFSTFLNQKRFTDEIFDKTTPRIVDWVKTERGMQPIYEEI